MRRIGKIMMMMLVLWMSTLAVSAQFNLTGDSTGTQMPVISYETEQLFQKLVPQRDSLYLKMATPKDKFGKRFSFHFNMLDWALTVPSFGIEFDLDKTEKNNRSILVFGKYKPTTTHTQIPQVVFNVQSARVEFRKYWRTGGIGKGRLNHQYEKIHLKRPKKLERTDYLIDQFDTIPTTIEYYANEKDSLLAEQYNGDPNRGWMYNHYMQFRRNVTSTRTLREPRNWRAYYLGAYAGVDKWDLCFNKKGKTGKGLNLGMTLGWTIPVLTRKFPNEGGLDLDLGLLVGVKAVKYDAYKFAYNEQNQAVHVALPDESKPSWSIVKYPVLHEARIAFVYRFRSISRKVSLSLVDDYDKKWVEPFETNRAQAERDRTDAISDRNTLALQQKREAAAAADSASFWNNWHERRLSNALLLNPDTVFTGQDVQLYQKLVAGKKTQQTATEQKNSSKKKLSKAERNSEKAAKKQSSVDVAPTKKKTRVKETSNTAKETSKAVEKEPLKSAAKEASVPVAESTNRSKKAVEKAAKEAAKAAEKEAKAAAKAAEETEKAIKAAEKEAQKAEKAALKQQQKAEKARKKAEKADKPVLDEGLSKAARKRERRDEE